MNKNELSTQQKVRKTPSTLTVSSIPNTPLSNPLADSSDAISFTSNLEPSLKQNDLSSENSVVQTKSLDMLKVEYPGSFGIQCLSLILSDPTFSDILELLSSHQSIFAFVIDNPSSITPKDIIEDYILFLKNPNLHSEFVSLSGNYGIIQEDQLLLIGPLPSEEEIHQQLSRPEQEIESIFDTISIPDNSNTQTIKTLGPIQTITFTHGLSQNNSIQIFLIEKEFKQLFKHKQVLHQITSHWKQTIGEFSDKTDSLDLNSLKSLLQSIDANSMPIEELVTTYQTNLRELEEKSSDLNLIEFIESRITGEYHLTLFQPKQSDDAIRDESFSSRIAALNLANFKLDHLGVYFDLEKHVHLIETIDSVGPDFVQLDGAKVPLEKLNIILNLHQRIIQAIDQLQQPPPGASITSSRDSSVSSFAPPIAINADSLLPLLIFVVVKANPPNLISNLRFIQRFRYEHFLTEQYSYALTNMMAIVSFIENVDFNSLGLSSEIHLSPVEDSSFTQSLLSWPGLPSLPLAGRVGKEIVGATGEGFKAISGVANMMLGRFLPTRVSTAREVQDTSSSYSFNPLPYLTSHLTTGFRSTKGKHVDQSEENAKEILKSIRRLKIRPPSEKFNQISSSELRVSDIGELLDDYHRISSNLKDLILLLNPKNMQ